MELLQHATYTEVRSLLGVSPKELPDATISLPHWMLAAEQDLLDLDGGTGAAVAQFTVVNNVTEASRTADQTQFFKVLNMYVLYHVGLQLLGRADNFSPQSITDGKASIDRLEDRFDKLRPVIEGGLQRLKERVKDALAVLDPAAQLTATVERVYAIGVGLGTDPVTGA